MSRTDRVGTLRKEPKSNRSAVVMHVKNVRIQLQCLDKARNVVSEIVKGVFELVSRRGVGMTKPDVVWRDQMESIGQSGHEVSEHLAAARQSVQQDNCRERGVARLAIENLASVDGGRAMKRTIIHLSSPLLKRLGRPPTV